ncbi:hypothetical protein [Desulfofustis limnaeus]|uniref:5-bromo-4-chloroindolyl phosphate hydrolysis protein n=1 Tax=Desulfofustis limnaeus TaxID=2740163 RepID=A0ABN6MCU5_9BACT|nr:hypothetical protein [Desulfofustis limnaeus]BDD89189.1 hypothetical protein DPPLL_35540 [Desulfofustis limnaeus]
MKNAFWRLGLAAAGGVIVGGIFTGNVETMLFNIAKAIYYRPFLTLLVALVLIAALGYVAYLERVEKVRIETELTDDVRQRIKAEVEHKLRTQKIEADRLDQNIASKRNRLRELTVSCCREVDLLQQNQIYLIYYIDAVQKLLNRRSQALQKKLPENPVAVEEIQKRNMRLHGELRAILDDIGKTFPDMTGALPKPKPPLADTSASDNKLSPGHIEVLQLKEELESAQRVREYEPKRTKKRRSI